MPPDRRSHTVALRNRMRAASWASLGVAAAALATLSLLESGAFSRVGWLHAPDVTPDGAATRVAISILLATLGFLVARGAARRSVDGT